MLWRQHSAYRERRIHLFLGTFIYSVFGNGHSGNCQPYGNHYLYRNRNEQPGLQYSGVYYCFYQSIASCNGGRCGHMHRLIVASNGYRRQHLHMVAIHRSLCYNRGHCNS